MRRLHRTVVATLLCLAMLLTVAMAGCATNDPNNDTPSTNEQTTTEIETETETEPTPSEGLEFALNGDGQSYSVTGIGTCTDSDIVIPSTYNSLPVTDIGYRAFYGCRSLKSITIPSSVTSISDWAFSDCYKLIEIYNLSNVNITAGANHYYYTKNVYTDASVPSKLVDEDGYIFYCDDEKNEYYLMGYNGTDTELTLPDNINGHNYEIYQFAFCVNTDITKVTVPNGVTSIGEYTFGSCTSLTSVTSGENSRLTSIVDSAFEDCASLESITIPNDVTDIGHYAFQGCTSLTSVTFGENSQLASIDSSAFSDCTNLTAVHISDIAAWCNISFSDFSSNPLSYARNLYLNGKLVTDLVIPDGVTSIGDYAFIYCRNLTSITIPSSVTSIDNYAFEGCESLSEVLYYCGTSDEWAAITDGGCNDNLVNATRYYYSETQPTDTTYTYWHYVDCVPTKW